MRFIKTVMPGLDPGIQMRTLLLDCRIKSGNDDVLGGVGQ